jgi:TRAP-type mannitol/chloroaromatic compound transport system substrate-binding protein
MRKRVFWGTAVALVGFMCVLGLHGQEAAAQSKTLKFQCAWGPGFYAYDSVVDFAELVEKMSAGKLKIEVLPAGAIVPAFELLDAVHKGVVDGAHTAAAYSVGKDKASGLFGPAPGGPFGFDVTDYFGWIYHGGGLELYRELHQDVLRRNVVTFPMTPVAPQVLGWFKRPIKNWEDMAGMKCREVGLTGELLSAAGMRVVAIPGGEILPAAERGVIDCGEWVGPAEDIKVGFHTVWKYYYMRSMHEPATILELEINGDVWKKLSPDLQEIIKVSSQTVTFLWLAKYNYLNGIALKELREKHGVNVLETPKDINIKMLKTWDKMMEEESAKNPFFKKVLESQRKYAETVVPTRRFIQPPYSYAADYYFPPEKQ